MFGWGTDRDLIGTGAADVRVRRVGDLPVLGQVVTEKRLLKEDLLCTHLPKICWRNSSGRNYAQSTAEAYFHAQEFCRLLPPTARQLGPQQISGFQLQRLLP